MIIDYSQAVRLLVDELKANCFSAGLGGDANEYKIVTQMFLYKFLNDKFLYAVKQKRPDLKGYKSLAALSDAEYKMLLLEIDYNAAQMKPQHLLEYLFSQQDTPDFAKTFDDTLNDIAILNNDIFSVHTEGNADIRLFDETLIQSSITDQSRRNTFAKGIINKLANSKFDFDEIFSAGFDFFSTLFEYMIKDYNKDGGGKYAEYYTPHSVAKIMAEILIGSDSDLTSQKVYDPSAGSGTLLMNIASKIGTDRCSIYSQDITQKSVTLLRLNLILNNLSHSIDNIVQGNTILSSKHNQKMDFIVSNPPFKLDFSEWRNSVETLPNYTERFFAGVPNITATDKDRMEIYLLFLQHILYSLNDTGRAAVVVPTGFITGGVPKISKSGKLGKGGIDYNIRKKIIDNNWLKGCVSMPSNIFATTGTNVSVLFIDKAFKGNPILVDASKLGEEMSIKNGSKKKKVTVMHPEDWDKIINVFYNNEEIENFSVIKDTAQIKQKNYSFSAGQYFDIKIEYVALTPDEFEAKMQGYKENLKNLFAESAELEKEIMKQLEDLRYE
ncbi:MAG: type I restriction-modification system subunit M [Bacteroidales bacterium]|jgi:type I restriction enzyme M protein|nr:type I restriction-modification system subunit M [Bacteroidales bacterium]